MAKQLINLAPKPRTFQDILRETCSGSPEPTSESAPEGDSSEVESDPPYVMCEPPPPPAYGSGSIFNFGHEGPLFTFEPLYYGTGTIPVPTREGPFMASHNPTLGPGPIPIYSVGGIPVGFDALNRPYHICNGMYRINTPVGCPYCAGYGPDEMDVEERETYMTMDDLKLQTDRIINQVWKSSEDHRIAYNLVNYVLYSAHLTTTPRELSELEHDVLDSLIFDHIRRVNQACEFLRNRAEEVAENLQASENSQPPEN